MSPRGLGRIGATVLAVVAVALGACSGDDGDSAEAPATTLVTAAAGCVEGPVTIEGVDGIQYCGPAQAELRVPEASLSISGGACRSGESFWTVNIGTSFPGELDPPPGHPYLGATIGAASSGPEIGDGDFPDVFLTWTLLDGSSDSASGVLALSEGGTHAVFEGVSLLGGADVLATIRC